MTVWQDNIIVEKSERLADRITKMYKYLSEKRSGDKDMLKQIVRSGTSVGANVSEGQYAQSKADFLTKMSIALKEANETRKWLNMLLSANCFTTTQFDSMDADLSEIIAMLVSSINTSKRNQSIIIKS